MEIKEPHPTRTRTTVSLSGECIVLLETFSEHQPHWTEDQLARFKIWSASLGVFENGHASIDYRLRDHPNVLNLVTQQLDVLRLNLEKLNISVSEPVQPQFGKRLSNRLETFDVDGEEFVYESPTSENSSSSVGSESESKDLTLSEGLQVVEETIARLNALSAAIRRAGNQSRASKADLFEVIEYVDGAKINVTQEFHKYAMAIVAREIPSAEHFLKKRLTVSIARRRNRFLYWKRHDKMSKIYVKKVMPSGQVKELRIMQQANLPQVEDQKSIQQNRMRDEGTVLTGFTATTFDAKNFRRPTATTKASLRTIGSVQLVFDNFQDWIGHMKKEQMTSEWYCASASHPPAIFNSQASFESHMRQIHPRGFNESQLHALAQRNMRFSSKVFTCCPFCPYSLDEDHVTRFSSLRNQDELQHHISNHLLSLAFISLPPMNPEDSPISESSGSSRAALDSRTGQSESLDHLQFDDIAHDLAVVENSVLPTNDWDWDFIRETLDKRSASDEDSPDSVLGRLQKMQLNQREAFSKSSAQAPPQRKLKLASVANPEYGNDTRMSIVELDGASPLTAPKDAAPLTSKYDQAERIQRHTVEDRQKVLGPDHTETLTSLNNLAQVLFFKGQYKEAEMLYQQALAGREKVLGPGHLDTIKSLNNLAQALVYLGHFKAAEELYRRALVQGEASLGLEHPYVLQNIHNLGGCLRNQGKHSEAETLYRQALTGREKVLGPEHPDTLQSVNNLGGTFEKMGKYDAAEKLYRKALVAREKVLGPDDADTLQSVHNVAGALRNQRRYTEAETLYREALEGREKTLGRNHPNTMRSLNNLALTLERKGRYVEAEQIYRQALAVREEVLGRQHPDTYQSINNIGSVRLHQQDYIEAESLYRQALEGRKKILGLDHPDTLQSVSNLGKALEKLKRHKEAETQYREALNGRMKLLGLEHPHTLQSNQDLSALVKDRLLKS